MSRITQVRQVGQEVIIYVDSKFCMSMSSSIWKKMNLHEGTNISCFQLKRRASFYWKWNHALKTRDRELQLRKIHTANGLENEEKLIDKAVRWIIKYLPELEVKRIDQHEMEPNLSLLLRGSIKEILAIQVLTAGAIAGIDHWVRLDFIEHIQESSDRDIWVASCFRYPKKAKMVWVKLDRNKNYRKASKATDSFMFFDNQSSECYTAKAFCDYIRNKIKEELTSDNN